MLPYAGWYPKVSLAAGPASAAGTTLCWASPRGATWTRRAARSSSELDGAGADFSQAFAYKGGMVWNFVYARRLLSNGTYRPIHDAVLGFEHCFTEKLRALEALRHPDGTPVYRVEETKPLLGSRAPRMEAERPKQPRWNGVDDPISHCLAGNSSPVCTEYSRALTTRPRGVGGRRTGAQRP